MVHPVARLVPPVPLLPLEQLRIGVAGILDALQALTVTALLERHIDSPDACALAVITSAFTKPETLMDQVAPEETVVVPIAVAPLYKVMVAVETEDVVAFVQVPVTVVADGVIGPFKTGASVQIAPKPVPPLLKLLKVKGGCDDIAVVHCVM
jgi:hypothetical protein